MRVVRFVAIALAVVAIALVGCREEGPAERAGKAIDEAFESMGDQAEDIAEAAEEAAEDAADAMREAGEDVAEASESAYKEAVGDR